MTWHGFCMAIALGLSIFFVEMSPRMTFITQHKQSSLIYLAAATLLSSVLIFLISAVNFGFVTYICFWSICVLYYTTNTISRY